MAAVTQRQQQILDFLREKQVNGATPTLREIASHFGFRSMNAARTHVQALRRKGLLENERRRARSLRVVSPLQSYRHQVLDIPLYGSIPAGFAEAKEQEITGCLSVDVKTLAIRRDARLFALRVHGDSMDGAHILDGDYVVLEHGRSPRSGDIVAALIDGESTLKTFIVNRGKPYLRAENPKYPEQVPANELLIQGVMVALVRKR